MFRHLKLFSQNHIGKYKYFDAIPESVKKTIAEIKYSPPIIPIVMGGNFIYKNLKPQFCPYNKQIVSMYSVADNYDIANAIKKSKEGKEIWNKFSLCEKIDIFNKAADLIETKYESRLIASTMMWQ